MNTYPKVKSVEPLREKKLLITFQNNIQKIYDCSTILQESVFSPLRDEILFRSVKTDQGGYGISWNDEIDLSESELWVNGFAPEQVY